MPISRYLKLTIGDQTVQVSDPKDLPVAIDYALEDPDNFQSKPSSQALSVTVPATLLNDVAANTFRNPDIADFTNGQVFRSNQPFTIDENGFEIMKGKAFLTKATHNTRPVSYQYNLYGDNSNWLMDLQESTLYDFLKNVVFDFTKSNIIASWTFDGTNEALPYVFAPVRYRAPMGGYTSDPNGNQVPVDDNYLPEYMKPSISKYFILYWAFKSVGYRIQSGFMDSEYFRRQVMPWTFGSFLESDGTKLEVHNFLAIGDGNQYTTFEHSSPPSYWDLKVTKDTGAGGDGSFDNNDNYQYDSINKIMIWTYKGTDNGTLEAHFNFQIMIDAALNGTNSFIECSLEVYKNVETTPDQYLITDLVYRFGGHADRGIKVIDFTKTVSFGDQVKVKVKIYGKASYLGFARLEGEVLGFKLDYFRIPLGGTIDFGNLTGFQAYKFIDFFAGVIDEFNLSFNTDPVNKVVVIEPTHLWSKDSSLPTLPGYFKDDFLDWNGKEDLSKDWEMDNYSDYSQQLTFKYKDDSNDGILKLVQDRHVIVLASGKYVFPPRFKTGTKAIENRFFAATMQYELDQWKALGTGSNAGVSPQMVCLVPENVSNTSNNSSANTFLPKSCYYKGNVTGAGAWKFDGTIYQTYPFLFSVNYKTGGQDDPVLSYSDENINGVLGKGLLKRFYWQRLAIMRNGQWYNTFFRLRNVDVVNAMHREYKSYKGHRWECVQISGYQPLLEDSTSVLLRKWSPVTIDDFNATFPSSANVLSGNGTNSFDIKYNPLKCLSTDVPT